MKKLIKKILRESTEELLKKCKAIDNKWGDDIRGVGDDSWSDLKSDIVSRGKEYYDRALIDFDLVQRMSNEDDYTESFSYAIPYKSDLI